MALLAVDHDGDVTLRRAKDHLDKANVLFATIEERSQTFARATYQSARRVDEWATNIVEKDKALCHQFVNHVDELGESLAREREKEQMELRTVADNNREVELVDDEVAELESIVNELQTSKDALPAKERRLKDDLKVVQALHLKREQHVRELERKLVDAIANVQDTINQYQDALGLKMEILDDGHIKFTFICVDPKEPQAKFEVEVKREGTDQLNAVACNPMVRRFSELKQTLTHDGCLRTNIRGFVCTTRYRERLPIVMESGVETGKGSQAGQPSDVNSLSSEESRLPLAPQAAAKRRERPPLRYTDDFATPQSVNLTVIGVVRSPYKERFGTPRQPNVTENTLGNKAQPARIELYKGSRFELGLRGLADFEYCWVLSFFHLNQGFNPLVTPPRGPRKKQGVFATRSPHRPNSIGLSCIRITEVEEDKGVIHLLGVDLLDGTAVLDIKPYVPYCDAFPSAKAGWLDQLKQDMKAPDALGYYPPPAHLMRPVSPPGQSELSGTRRTENEEKAIHQEDMNGCNEPHASNSSKTN